MTAELYIYLSIINLCIFLSVYPSIYLSFYLFIFFSFVFFNFTNLNISETLSWQPSRRIIFLAFTFTLIQIKNRMMTRQMTTMNQRMRCLRKQRGVPQPIKTFLSEILWHKFQTCLLMKTLGSKPNTMYGFHSQYNYYIDCMVHFYEFAVNTNMLSIYTQLNTWLTGHSKGWATFLHRGKETWK